ncbi:MAG TPA: nuclear transport factor 2 family protein [Roseiflexaceae bacterium]|nr:nuclear transport factor 2 family protein [Roseiflexaceae bacterium]
MSTESNLTIAQGIYSAFGQGNIPAILDVFADDVELHEPPGGTPPFTGVYHGLDGAATFFRNLVETVDVLAMEPQEFVAQGDVVVVLGHYRFRPKTTGIPYDTDWAMVWRFRDGKVSKFQVHYDTATEAAAFSGMTVERA